MKPILHPTQALRAKAIDGTRTQFRLVIKPQPWYEKGYWFYEYKKGCSHYIGDTHPTEHWNLENMLPYAPHAIGDILYHAEPYQIVQDYGGCELVGFYSDDNQPFNMIVTINEFSQWIAREKPYRKSPARWMYKSLARYFYKVTNVRAGELQKISEADAKAEGVDTTRVFNHEVVDGIQNQEQYRPSFIDLWDSTHKKPYLWDDNPWNFIFDIKRVERPVK